MLREKMILISKLPCSVLMKDRERNALRKSANKKGLVLTRPFLIFNPAATYFPMTLSIIVSSALEGLTSVFGMGTGGAPPASPPETVYSR